MQARRASRLSAPAMVTVVLLALAASSPVTSAAKCFYSKSKSTPSPVFTEAPEVTEEPILEDPTPIQSFATSQATEGSSFTMQITTQAPETLAGSYEATQSSEDSSNAAEPAADSSQSTQDTSTQIQGPPDGSTGDISSTTSVGVHAPFGDITSPSGKCVIGNPTTDVTRKDVDWVWKNTIEKDIAQFKNLIFDQLITNNGSLSYCVRWETDKKLTKSVASKFQAMIERQINLWNHWLVGYACWPIEKIDITVVGFAVRDKSIMDWSDDSLGTIYEGVLDAEGIPKCPDDCYKHKNRAANADTSACKGKPFDMSLWPSVKPGEGAIGTGGDWGQRVEVNDMLNTMDDEQMIVLLHEMGHGFGLPEMYLAENKPSGYPACVMDEGMTITAGDGWLLRSILENIKSRYNF